MRFLPRSLFAQILLALLIGLLAAQAVGTWLMLDDRLRLTARVMGGYAAQRIAGIVTLLDEAAPMDRSRLVNALSVPPTRVSLTEPWRTYGVSDSAHARAFVAILQQSLGQPREVQVLSVVVSRDRAREERERRRTAESGHDFHPRALREDGRPPPFKRGGRFPLVVVMAQIRLTDGAVATFRHALPQPPTERPLRLVALVAVTGITVALLAGWTVRRLTRPLATLADAATGLARNLDQPPLPERGPTEVSRAAKAFNAMQRELKAYVETRAQALAGVSHDLRLPLTRVRLRLERIADAEVKRSIESDLDEMEHMIAGTLDYLRAGRRTEAAVLTNIDALVEGVAEDIEALGATVRVHGKARTALNVRPQALRRCLANLMENARRYGGNDIDVSIVDAPDMLILRVEDRGPGIPASERQRVFEPYVRLEQSRAKHTGGTGLGLAIARAIARSHGGDVLLSNRIGGGLTVDVQLPRRVAGEAPARP
jgi:signal transduction histidine kinase